MGCVGALARDRLTVELHRMSVSVAARRRGVGRLLIGALEVTTPHTCNSHLVGPECSSWPSSLAGKH